jgi:CelD/BcsL family acetyltransferase involved in cellulose biosynthesis
MNVECVTQRASLEPLRPVWNLLAADVVFRRWEWLTGWWQAYASLGELCVLVVRDDLNQVLGIAPWYRERSFASGRTLRWLGAGKACSEYNALLIRPGSEAPVVSLLADWLVAGARASTHRWDQLDLEAVSPSDWAIGELASQLQHRGAEVSKQSGPDCWSLALPSGWDELYKQIKPQLRSKLRRLERKSIASGQARLQVASSDDDFHCLFQQLVDFHQRRWAQVGIDGCFTDRRFTHFLRQALDGLRASGDVRLVGTQLDGQTIAVACLLRSGRGYALYQCGMDPDRLNLQPGWLMMMLYLQDLMELGAGECDFLRGAERYKRELGAQARRQLHWRLAAPHASGRFRHELWKTQTQLRSWGQQLFGAHRT